MIRERWREVTIVVLVFVLLAAGVNLSVLHKQNVALQAEAVKTCETLVNQTQLIVELRKQAVPKEFNSLDELKQWVDDWEVNNRPTVLSILNRTFVLSGNSELYSRYWDCDDISEAMQRDALRDGYLMSIALVDGSGMVCGRKVSALGWHAGNQVVVENAFYFIEPQTDTIQRGGLLPWQGSEIRLIVM